MTTLDAILREPRFAPLQRHLATLSTAERVTLGAALLGEGLAALASNGKRGNPMGDDSGFSDYIAVPKFLADTGMNKSLVYRLLRRGTLDGFQLDGTRKWVIHRNALEVMRRQRLWDQLDPERQ